MIRVLLGFLVFLALAVLQTSVIASLPGILAYVPLVLAAGVYLVQHMGGRAGTYWIAGFGLFLDVLSIPSFPLETVSCAVGGITAYLTARHLFSNRSWYGLTACGLTSVVSIHVIRALVLAFVSFRHPERISWLAYGDTLLWNALLITVLLTVFFGFSRQIRNAFRIV